MLRNSNVAESDIRYYANGEINDWPKLLSTLCILTNEDIDVRKTIEELNNRE